MQGRYCLKPTLIFDFDGTVANSIDKILELINHLAPGHGYNTVSRELFEKVRDLPLPLACLRVKFPLYKLGQAIAVVLTEYRRIIPDLEPCAGIVPVLELLKAEGYTLGLISSNHAENVQAFLDHNGIHCFDWVEGTGGILHKHSSIKSQIRKHALDRQSVIYIGDEARDIRAARKAGVKVISVTWGLHSAKNLHAHSPDHMATNPSTIPGLVTLILNNRWPKTN
jgi:phosphoglycolate phosphatase